MQRVAVTELKVGQRLKKPLYSRTGQLLLADEQILTRKMWTSLEASGLKYVFLGEWDTSTAARIETSCADYRTFGSDLMQKLQRQIEDEINDTPQEVTPSGEPLSKRIQARPAAQTSKADLEVQLGTYLNSVEKSAAILSGGIANEELPAAAQSATEQILGQFKRNPNIFFALLRLRNVGAYLDQHSVNTAALAMSIGTAMEFSELQVMELGIAALFKDIGMRGAPPELLTATRRLTPSEHVDIQKHTIAGLNSMQEVLGLQSSVRFSVYQHHERADGMGYPKRRKKARMHTFSRIIAVADAFDSLTSPRPWRPAMHPYRAMESLLHNSERAYDSVALRGLLQYTSLFPVGSLMRLDTGDIVRVIGTTPGHIHNPVVMVVRAETGSGREVDEIIDLLENRDVQMAAPFEGSLTKTTPLPEEASFEDSPYQEPVFTA